MKRTLLLAVVVQLFLVCHGASSTLLPLGHVEKACANMAMLDASAIGFEPFGMIESRILRETLPAKAINPNHLLQEAPAYPTGNDPVSMAMGDFNGDGREDLVTVSFSSNNVSILLGNGDGTFAPPVNYATQYYPNSLAVGDFNGDGKLDIAVTNLCGDSNTCQRKGTVSILLGNGDGTFQPQMDFGTAGFHPVSVAVGDFNGDKKLDLAVANSCGATSSCEAPRSNVVILLGDGDGTFQQGNTLHVGAYAQSVAVADFNGDGKLDLAVADNGDGTASILPGNGDGTFSQQVDYATGSSPYSVAVGDFNGDGKVDLAIADDDNEDGAEVSVLLGNGDGTFQPHVDYPTGQMPLWVVVSDLNGDSKQDLVVANSYGNTVSVLLGNGDGTFQPSVDYGVQSGPSAVVVGNFSGNGSPDVIAANAGTSTVTVLLGDGTGAFPTRQDFPSVVGTWAVSTGDFDGDGIPDIVTANNDRNTVSILLGKGDGTFQPHVEYPTGNTPYEAAVGDFNGDGKLDLATANEQGTSVSILLGNGDGSFQPHMDYAAGINPFSIAAGDFNGDGKLDLVTANVGASLDAGTITVLLGNGDGTFQPPVPYSTGIFPYSVTVGDFNGDYKLDIAVANNCGNDTHCQSVGSVSIFLGNGDGTFQPQVPYNVENAPVSVVTGDFNKDGNLDLAVTNSKSSTVSILLGNGDGTFQPDMGYVTEAGPNSVAVGDFNGDGKVDLVTTDGGTASVLLGNGDGTFQNHVDFEVGAGSLSVIVADFNGDGKTDLATANSLAFSISVLLNTSGSNVTLTSSPNPSTQGQPVTFTARVAGTLLGEPIPNGSITFKIGARMNTENLIHGVATFTTSTLPVGKTRVVAHYSGNRTFNPTNSAPLIQVVSDNNAR